jgi:hypothetical protein
MRPEQVLYFSNNCFGTADAIAYNEKKKFLRIHDFKSGKIPASLHQLEIYASLFCLPKDRQGRKRMRQRSSRTGKEPYLQANLFWLRLI